MVIQRGMADLVVIQSDLRSEKQMLYDCLLKKTTEGMLVWKRRSPHCYYTEFAKGTFKFRISISKADWHEDFASSMSVREDGSLVESFLLDDTILYGAAETQCKQHTPSIEQVIEMLDRL
jgi:hypothetical protein